MSVSTTTPGLGRVGSAIGAVCVVALLAACTATPMRTHTPEEIVTERAQTRWDAQLAGNWEKTYSFTAPSYRAVIPLNAYRAQIGGAAQWIDARVVSVSCETQSCTASIRLEFQPLLGMRHGSVSVTHFDERWVLEEGEWWLFKGL